MVAQQILSVLSALAANVTSFTFEGHKIKLVWSCGIFITMNPGGRHGRALWLAESLAWAWQAPPRSEF